MLDLFYMGGPLFMGILTLIFIIMVIVSVVNAISIVKGKTDSPETAARKISQTKSVGLFALIIGLLGQLIGLFSAFQAIEVGAVQVSPTLLAAGFKVSMITTIYGIVIYVISFLIWFGMTLALSRK